MFIFKIKSIFCLRRKFKQKNILMCRSCVGHHKQLESGHFIIRIERIADGSAHLGKHFLLHKRIIIYNFSKY